MATDDLGRDIARALVGCDTDAATSLAMSHGAGQEAAGVVSEFQQVLEAIEALPQLETEGSEYQPGTHIRYRLFESGQRIFAGSGFPLAIGYGARGSCLWNRLDLDDPETRMRLDNHRSAVFLIAYLSDVGPAHLRSL